MCFIWVYILFNKKNNACRDNTTPLKQGFSEADQIFQPNVGLLNTGWLALISPPRTPSTLS
jgi:hypothetical protein